MTQPEQSLAYDEDFLDPEVIEAGQYLVMRGNGMKMDDIAQALGLTHRNSVYARIEKWERSGALKKAEQLYLLPKQQNIQQAIDNVLGEWPTILDKIVKIAKNGRSERVSLEAAAFLYTTVVKPALDAKDDPGSAEKSFAEKPGDYDPTVIVGKAVPKALRDKL